MLLVKNSVSIVLITLLFISGCSTRFEPEQNYNQSKQNTQTNQNKQSQTTSKKNKSEATMRPYQVGGHWYYPKKVDVGHFERGIGSWYGEKYHGRKTSNGETFNMYSLTAAHKTLPMNTMVYVKNIENDKSVIVRINDRGPFIGDRIIDLSKKSAEEIGMLKDGTTLVEIKILGYNGKKEIDVYEEPIFEENDSLEAKDEKSENIEIVAMNESVSEKKESNDNINLEITKNKSTPLEFQTTTIKPLTIIGTQITSDSVEDEKPEIDSIDISDSDKNLYPIGNDSEEFEVKKEENLKIISQPKPNLSNEKIDIQSIETAEKLKKEQLNKIKEDSKEADAELEEESSSLPLLNFYDDSEFKINYYVQVGSFREESGAKRFKTENESKLVSPLSFKIAKDSGIFKVWIQGFANETEARNYIHSNGIFKSAWLVMKEE